MQAGEQRRHGGPFTARVCDKADKVLIVRDIGGELALYWQSVSNPAPRRMVEGQRSLGSPFPCAVWGHGYTARQQPPLLGFHHPPPERLLLGGLLSLGICHGVCSHHSLVKALLLFPTTI